MTKSLSNLFKGGYIVRKENSRVIDYNDLVASKLEQLSGNTEFVPVKEFQQPEQEEPQGFVEGLNVDELEVILEEEVEQEKAEPTSEELYEAAKREVEKMLQDAETEAEMIRNEAYEMARKKGYEAGHNDGLKEIEKMKEELEEKEALLVADYNAKVEELEPLIVEKVADLMEYVFRVQFSTSRAMIMHILSGALGKINNSKEFIVHVSHEDVAVVKANHDKLLAMVPNAVSVEVAEDPALVKNQCMIETDGGVYDCSLDVQMEKLIKSIKTLSYTP
ncbi:MAG: hypothetical protein IJA36_08950 [Lachnospiraceae bacterium]|nr:hypothetical protein [Lachnospiraceae bacterium]